MARYIDTQKVTVPRGFFNKNLGVPDLLKWLEAQPAADVVEVVRCKDCKYAKPMSFKGYFVCKRHHKYCRKADDFCSYGERREQ